MANTIIIDCYEISLRLGAWLRVPIVGAADRWARIERLDPMDDGATRVVATIANNEFQPPLAMLVG